MLKNDTIWRDRQEYSRICQIEKSKKVSNIHCIFTDFNKNFHRVMVVLCVSRLNWVWLQLLLL